MSDINRVERKLCESFCQIEELDQLFRITGMSRTLLNNTVGTYIKTEP
ncbi:MAG: hypothetical protein KUF77_05675 [Candidatus Thiodiazotropha sp. (ex Lucina aurantia)]|uniref:Uncharacterized protein n=1 Tax=Candidatus Thiodiazotropha taylori TaxID=2792791 RepID=A0A9E4TU79_9GAMM|nr:hypothetical protein [Candidatus Thiodiazotropha sp. (ex Lucina pensylvanica)]MBT3021746.1 hypothetical protein [Candidatus Thiodiazotropha taylori]MBT3051138.1 hypothetical protein [Candidatus Thiodiazotropha sp. (ex Codakia orbicularis)]MBV2102495.1 hypothetical protein [Candidatus Thiodiazotropha sp. (ex Lucina aurantia)]MCG8025895.1 hypothetical protein [Candidatus Thiodiazotropha endolucinida]